MAECQRYPLPLATLMASLERPLALVEDEGQRARLRAYLELVRVHLERSLLDVLSEVANQVNQAQSQVEARVQYESGSPEWVLEPRASNPAQDPSWLSGGDQEKVTIRIPAELKELIGFAASRSGISVNAWYIRMLAGALNGLEGDPRDGKDRGAERASQQQAARHGHGTGRKVKGIVGR